MIRCPTCGAQTEKTDKRQLYINARDKLIPMAQGIAKRKKAKDGRVSLDAEFMRAMDNLAYRAGLQAAPFH